jgi:hypothetical protein
MRRLLTVTALIEATAGVPLLVLSSLTATILLGRPLVDPAALTVARVGGAGLLTIGMACWLARGDAQSDAARGLVTALVIYNVGAVAALGVAAIEGIAGIALWPAILLHVAMAAWCVVRLLGDIGEVDRLSNT